MSKIHGTVLRNVFADFAITDENTKDHVERVAAALEGLGNEADGAASDYVLWLIKRMIRK